MISTSRHFSPTHEANSELLFFFPLAGHSTCFWLQTSVCLLNKEANHHRDNKNNNDHDMRKKLITLNKTICT